MDQASGADLVGAPVRVKGPTAAMGEARGGGQVQQRGLSLDARVVLSGILVLAAGLRVAFLATHSVWLDEVFVVWLAQHPWRGIPGLLRIVDQHPPFYFLLMHVWIGVAGASEVAIRFPSACFSLCSVLLVYGIVRRVSTDAVGLLSAFLVAISPFQIMAAQEARMYPLLGALGLASTAALLAGVDRGGVMRWAAYVVAAAVMVYTHYFGVLVLLAHGVWVGWCERRHLGTWMAGIAIVGALYTPWVPALVEQVGHVHSFAWYHNRAVYMNLGDLLGLSAFGGSLFGSASYFFAGTLGTAEQIIVLLPFLILLWRGVVGFASDRRALAIVALPPAVTIGVMGLLSVTRPMFVPRWFSFLTPFLATFLARGVYDVAEHLDIRRDRVAAFLVGALLLYQLPVLDRYYLDPGFRPFQWRAAARLVKGLVRPGDAFVFVGSQAALPFRYYFRDPYPSVELSSSDRLTLTDAQVRALAARHPRVWIIATIPFAAETRGPLLEGLGRAYRVAGLRDFSGAIVYLLSKPAASADR
jgi:4-amino-4-deoxy-L-arabinose transferase-like glycosyltransferase